MNKSLQKAIDAVEGQENLASAIGCSQSMISYWLHKAKKGVPSEYCLPIEQATSGKIRREQLRPDVFGVAQ